MAEGLEETGGIEKSMPAARRPEEAGEPEGVKRNKKANTGSRRIGVDKGIGGDRKTRKVRTSGGGRAGEKRTGGDKKIGGASMSNIKTG